MGRRGWYEGHKEKYLRPLYENWLADTSACKDMKHARDSSAAVYADAAEGLVQRWGYDIKKYKAGCDELPRDVSAPSPDLEADAGAPAPSPSAPTPSPSAPAPSPSQAALDRALCVKELREVRVFA
jgi:hypothetical protein